jgi:uncharacterized protein YbjT (DUF2867 family)
MHIVVVGSGGPVGKSVAEALWLDGHHVRQVSRRAGFSLDDRAGLDIAFCGADAAFLMIPFDRAAHDLHAREDEIARALSNAVARAQIPRVVSLSGTSAHLGERAGSGYGAAILEQRLNALGIPELVHLRACFLMENHLQGIPLIRRQGIYAWAFRPDRPTPMVAARDVSLLAAEILVDELFDQPQAREVLGARDYSFAEATSILGSAIDKPDLRYVQLAYEEAREAMVANGVSESFADAVMQTAHSFNDGERWEQEQRSMANTTVTTLEEFAGQVFRSAYRNACGS